MNFFEIILVDFIFITFPLMLYLFYIAYNKNIGKRENSFIFDITLFTSLYLIIKFGVSNYIGAPMLIVNVPLMIAYYKKNNLTIFLLSFFIIIYNYVTFDFNLIIITIEYFLYYFTYILFLKSKKNVRYFEILFIVIKFIFSFFLLWGAKYFNQVINITIFRVFVLSIITFLVAEFVLILMEQGEEILKYHMSVKELEREKQIRTSLFKITHEIKNPLAVCKGYLDMMDINNLKQTKKYISIIKSEVDRTLVILQDFLCMNKSKFEKEPMDVNLLVEDVVNNFNPILKKKNIKCNVKLLDDEIYIYGDYNRLMQVFINLIKNSIEAIEHNNGIINIETQICNKNFKVTIEDNGCGMSDDIISKMSEPFFTTKKEGTGLGVSLSKEILEAHKSKLEYKSGQGKGTIVTISIPIDTK